MGISMLRDLWIGGALGIVFYWWRTQSQRVENTVQQSQNHTQHLQQQLTNVQQELATVLGQRTALETQVAELNQIAIDRAIDLIQLQADNAELLAQVATLSQKRTRKKRAVKAVDAVEEAIATPLETPLEPIAIAELAPEPPTPEPFALNLELIQAKQLESIEATQLLQTVFIEESIAAPAPATALGLDSAHSAFLQTLKTQTLWSREDLVRVAQQLDLLLDGALELINEAAFDRCDEALTEGEDPLEVNPNVLQEMLS
jgi:chromosome segregation ATPase